MVPQAYSCGWKKARAEGKSSSGKQKAGNDRREQLLTELCKIGVKVALEYRDDNK